MTPADTVARDTLVSGFFLVEMVAANGLAAIALLALVARARRHEVATPLGRALPTMVRVAALGYLPYAATARAEWSVPGSIPGGTQPFTLLFVAVPIGFALALLRLRAGPSDEARPATSG